MTSSAAGGEAQPATDGPLLTFIGLQDGRLELAAIAWRPEDAPMPALLTDSGPVEGGEVAHRRGVRVYRYRFSLPARADAWYRFDGATFAVNAAFEGDLRIAYVSCNGQVHGDLERSRESRNALWARLVRQHREQPFQLVLHGGDQIYADEVLRAHPAVRAWSRSGRDVDAAVAGGEVAAALDDALFDRYLRVYGQPEPLQLLAAVPSLAMWDDHDICDGWGSLRAGKLDTAVGRTLFHAARRHFLLFQLGAEPEELPDCVLDRSGRSLTWHVRLPGLDIIAPDLRSERRPDRVMADDGWAAFQTAADAVAGGRVLLLSSVPALGPRLSWLEAAMALVPSMQKYEDDLRDQWQSRAHREEWRRFLRCLIEMHVARDSRVTVLSGEIHLATRGTMDTAAGPIHQLTASGIAHTPPPRGFARGLGALARLGSAPLPDHPIRLRPLPGRSAVYTAQRNYLVLERRDGAWSAQWELEDDGTTPPLPL